MEKLTAPTGKLYQFKNDIYVCGKEIYLGVNDSLDNWQLINEEDKPIRPMPEEE